jgi:regulator of sigma E protease
MPDSPAEHAGVKPGDVIVSIDGHPVTIFDDIRDQIGDRANVAVSVVVKRDGREVPLTMTPAPFEEQDDLETTHRGVIGIRALPPPSTIGVLDPASPAYKAGLRTFDRIVSIDGQAVSDGLDLEHRLAAGDDARPIDVLALRGHALGYAGLGPGLLQPVPLKLAAGPHAGIELDDLFIRWVIPGSPAAKAGLHVGDKLLALNGKPLGAWWGFENEMKTLQSQPIALAVQSPGQAPRTLHLQAATIDLGESKVTGGQVQVLTLGILHDGEPLLPNERVLPRDWIFPTVRTVPRPISVAQASLDSWNTTVDISRKEILGILRIFQGRISVKNLGGPLMIADVARQAAQEGLAAFLFMMTLVSINLGLVNLIPMPALDGGHIATALVETVRRKPLSMRAREVTQAFGLVLLLALMAFVIINDFVQKRGPSLYP